MTPTPNIPNIPAFPAIASTGLAHMGMSLRDWFASQALIGLLFARVPGTPHQELAWEAWGLADALLRERSHPKESPNRD